MLAAAITAAIMLAATSETFAAAEPLAAAAAEPTFAVMRLPPLPVEPPSAIDAAAAATNETYEHALQHPNCLVRIRDQGRCGSCWAFAASGSLADRTCIRTGKPTMLSPQDLLDCDDVLGCSMGVLPAFAWSFLRNTGVAEDDCVPYAHYPPKKNRCRSKCFGSALDKETHKAANVTHHHGVAAIMAAVREGPVDVTFNVHGDFDEHWRAAGDATYVHRHGGFTGIHSVKLVGFGVDAHGTPYWTCENSWGCSGGFGFVANGSVPTRCFGRGGRGAGYFRIRRGTNECGIESMVYSGWPALEM